MMRIDTFFKVVTPGMCSEWDTNIISFMGQRTMPRNITIDEYDIQYGPDRTHGPSFRDIEQESYNEYYTPDEVGFQRYLDHVLMNQACGMEEIVHAPLWAVQDKWGDMAIRRLHQALSNTTKRSFTFQADPWDDFDTFLNDLVENFNKWEVVIPVSTCMAILTILSYIRRKRE